MDFVTPSVTDIVGGVLSLAAGGERVVRLAQIHSILYEMKPREPVLANVRFSITGDICYSRKIDRAIDVLADRGFLRRVDASTVFIERVPHLRTRFLTTLTYSQFHALQSASRHFHERLDRAAAPVGRAAQG